MQTSGRVEYMYVTVDEEVEIKLTAQHFNVISTSEKPCSDDINYSAIQCFEIIQLEKIMSTVGCTAPWMRHDDFSYCSNFTQMKELISKYQGYHFPSNFFFHCVFNDNLFIIIFIVWVM